MSVAAVNQAADTVFCYMVINQEVQCKPTTKTWKMREKSIILVYSSESRHSRLEKGLEDGKGMNWWQLSFANKEGTTQNINRHYSSGLVFKFQVSD